MSTRVNSQTKALTASRAPALQTPYLKILKGPENEEERDQAESNSSKRQNFVATSEHGLTDLQFPAENQYPQTLYFAQILTEREAHTASITGDKSSKETKSKLANHNS